MTCAWLKKAFALLIALLSLAACACASPAIPLSKERRAYLSPLKTPGPLRIEPLTTAWRYPTQIIYENNCTICAECLPTYLANLPKAGRVYHFNSGIKIEWPSVVNINNTLEDGAVYVLRRYNSASSANQDKDPVVVDVVYATNPQPAFYSYEDMGAHHDTIYWYRVVVTDYFRRSIVSNTFFASYQDNRPPAAPADLHLDEVEKAVRISWQPVMEPDLAGYLIYRRVCKETVNAGNFGDAFPGETFELVGTIEKSSKPFFVDYYPPKNPSYSYMYCVKSIDQSQNISINTISNVICSHEKKRDGSLTPRPSSSGRT